MFVGRLSRRVANTWIKNADRAISELEEALYDSFGNGRVHRHNRTTFIVRGRSQNYEVSYHPYAGREPYSISIIRDEGLDIVDTYEDPTVLVEMLERMVGM